VRYLPGIIGAARVTFSDRALGLDSTDERLYLLPVTADLIQVDWTESRALDIRIADLSRQPQQSAAEYARLPAVAAQPRKYAAWEKSFARWVGQNARVEILRHPALGVASRVGESERDFRIRLQLESRAARDLAVDAVRKKYAQKAATLAERLRRAQQTVEREHQQASDQKVQTAVSMGATLLGALLGRKAASAGTIGRATTAARGIGRSLKEASDVKRAAETVEAVQAAVADLDAQIAADVATVRARFEPETPLERTVVSPRRGQVEVQFVALVWTPAVP